MDDEQSVKIHGIDGGYIKVHEDAGLAGEAGTALVELWQGDKTASVRVCIDPRKLGQRLSSAEERADFFRSKCRAVAQTLIEETGAPGPEDVRDTAARAASLLGSREATIVALRGDRSQALREAKAAAVDALRFVRDLAVAGGLSLPDLSPGQEVTLAQAWANVKRAVELTLPALLAGAQAMQGELTKATARAVANDDARKTAEAELDALREERRTGWERWATQEHERLRVERDQALTDLRSERALHESLCEARNEALRARDAVAETLGKVIKSADAECAGIPEARSRYGARKDERLVTFLARLAMERDEARSDLKAHVDGKNGAATNDLVRLAMERAAKNFDPDGNPDNDGIFTNAGFAVALARLSDAKDKSAASIALGAGLVRVILAGRPDVQVLQSHEHYALLARELGADHAA